MDELPPKPKPRESKRHEVEAFLERYELYAMTYGDPVQRVFQIMAAAEDEQVALRAAELLMGYRYPRIKAVDDQGKTSQTFQFIVAPGPLPEHQKRPALERVLNISELTG